jgi:hypothetical protein
MGDQTTKLCDFTNVPNAQFIVKPITSPEIKADSFEVSPSLLNLIVEYQFGGSASEEASMHLHDFCEICDMQKFKNVGNYTVKLKLFPLYIRGKYKDCLLSLPNGSINSRDNLRETFIKKYYPSVKILQNRNNILSFRQNDNEHVATSWERLKITLRTCPSHGVNEWTVLNSFYTGLNYMSSSMLDSSAGGVFMTKTVTKAKEIIENMLQNFSQWHTERASSSSRKAKSVEEVDSLTAKFDATYSYISKQKMLIMFHYLILLRIIMKKYIYQLC